MKLIIFILIVLIIAALLIRIILRSVNQHSPLLMQLHAAGIRTGDAERILSGGEYWQRQKTLLTEREVSFMKGLFRIVDMKRWYLCPQVRGRGYRPAEREYPATITPVVAVIQDGVSVAC
ncbi:w0003 [Escherichia coli]|nr:w0003 [Escherichia coli]